MGHISEPTERTTERTTEIEAKGMTLVGIAQYGIEGVTSGLYIEMIWNYDDKQWEEYMDFVDNCINKQKVA